MYSPLDFSSYLASIAFFAKRETVYFGTFITAAISSHLVTPDSMTLRNTSIVWAGLCAMETSPFFSVTKCHSNAGISSWVLRYDRRGSRDLSGKILIITKPIEAVPHRVGRHFGVEISDLHGLWRFSISKFPTSGKRVRHCRRQPCLTRPAEGENKSEITFGEPVAEDFFVRRQFKSMELT
jgi:hypothetical protein